MKKKIELLRAKGLQFSYPEKKDQVIIKDLDLTLFEGDMVAIKGPSGSGKSTLLYLLSAMYRPDQGDVFFKGKSILNLSEEEEALFRHHHVGFVFQNFHLSSELTALENVYAGYAFPLEKKGSQSLEEARQAARGLLEKLGLSHVENHLPRELSGGQQQRVAIARTLFLSPDIILADEPTGNLDEASTKAILKIFQEINTTLKKTLVIITHEEEVAKSCKKILFFRDGKIQGEVCGEFAEDGEEVDSRSGDDGGGGSDDEEKGMRASPLERKENKPLFVYYFDLLKLSVSHMRAHYFRSILTSLGLAIGVGAIVVSLCLGIMAQGKVLQSFNDLGVNNFIVGGNRSWRMKESDLKSSRLQFEQFDYHNDLQILLKYFPEIKNFAPLVESYDRVNPILDGVIEKEESEISGTSSHGFKVLNTPFAYGKSFHSLHVQDFRNYCVIGFDVISNIKNKQGLIGKTISFNWDETSFSCRILGVLKKVSRSGDSEVINKTIYLPYTTLIRFANNIWNVSIKKILIGVREGEDVTEISKAIEFFFRNKYGKTGRFWINSEADAIKEMNRVIVIFNFFLILLGLITLTTSGMNVTNLLLMNLRERIREIGLWKSLGATHKSIGHLFFMEAFLLNMTGGVLGLIVALLLAHASLFVISIIIPKVSFELMFFPSVFAVAFVAIFLSAFFSGFLPNKRARALSVAEALRSE